MFFAASIAVALAIPAPIPQNAAAAPRPIAPVAARPAGAAEEGLEGSDDKKDLEASQSVGYGYYGGFPGYYSTGYYPYSSSYYGFAS